MEKYGFVYIWFDRKHKRYYIGSHWGTEDDGYICSSKWMKRARDRRPQDFKRRIIKKVYDRSKLFEEETYFLQMIKDDELNDRYYNLNKSAGHWSQYPEGVNTIKEKISHKTRVAMNSPEVREKMLRHYDEMKGSKQDPIVVEKRRQSMIKTMAEKFPVENRMQPLTEDQRREYYSEKARAVWSSRNEEDRAELAAKISASLKGKKNRLGHTNTQEHTLKIRESNKKFYSENPLDWITDGAVNKRIPRGQVPPEGWRLGKTVRKGWKKRKMAIDA